jgi:hypothetical protein
MNPNKSQTLQWMELAPQVWFKAVACGTRRTQRTQRNTYLKVAGFHSPISGWF